MFLHLARGVWQCMLLFLILQNHKLEYFNSLCLWGVQSEVSNHSFSSSADTSHTLSQWVCSHPGQCVLLSLELKWSSTLLSAITSGDPWAQLHQSRYVNNVHLCLCFSLSKLM